MKKRCRHRHALVVVASPAAGVLAVRWCPECGALYHSRYKAHGWAKREWQSPGGPAARAYVALRLSVEELTPKRLTQQRLARVDDRALALGA